MISFFTSILRFVYRTVLLTGYLVFMLGPTLMRVNYYRRRGTAEGSRKADEIAVRLARRLTWFFGIRIEISGTPVEGAVLFAANHISWLDIPVLHSGCAMGFVGKAEIEQWPIFRSIARTGGTIFHQRGDHNSAVDVSSVMVQRLQQGRAVTIFPEGGIKPGADVRIFHARMFRPAVEVGCPVQPVMIRYMSGVRRDDDISFRQGEGMMKNLGRLLARPGARAEVHFLSPMSAAGMPRRALSEAAREAVVESYERL